MLDKRPFGNTSLMVAPLTFGAWSIGGPAEMGGVGVITRGALEKGLLTGTYLPGHRFDAHDVRSRFVPEFMDPILVGVQKLKQRAAEEGWSLLGMALNFQLAHPGCSTIAVGMKTRQQVEQNVTALNERSDYDWNEIIETLHAI